MKPNVAPWDHSTMCMRIMPLWGPAVYITDYIRNLTIDGQVYITAAGYEWTGYDATSDFSPGAIDFAGILESFGVSRNDISSGVYDNARCYIFATDWNNPVIDEEPILSLTFGMATLTDDRFSIQAMPLIDALNQSVGNTYSVTCQKRFGQSDGPLINRCNYDAASVTVTGTLTSVTSQYTVQDATRTEVDDYFAYGTLAFTTGNNAGLKPIEIKVYSLDGTIEVFEALPYIPQVGDQYVMVPGCRKRLEDCRDKWDNVVNFGGFQRIPTRNQSFNRGTK